MRVWMQIGSVVALLLFSSAAFAASEQDRQDCRASQDRDRQIAACSRVIESGGEAARSRALAYAYRGIAYAAAKKDYDRAIADLSEAIRLDPKYIATYNNRGYVYFNKKNYDRAIADYNEAIRLDPSFERAYRLRALAYERIGRKDDAISDYRKSLLLNPSEKLAIEGLKRLGAKPF